MYVFILPVACSPSELPWKPHGLSSIDGCSLIPQWRGSTGNCKWWLWLQANHRVSNYVSWPKISKCLPQNTLCAELLIPAFLLRAAVLLPTPVQRELVTFVFRAAIHVREGGTLLSKYQQRRTIVRPEYISSFDLFHECICVSVCAGAKGGQLCVCSDPLPYSLEMKSLAEPVVHWWG